MNSENAIRIPLVSDRNVGHVQIIEITGLPADKYILTHIEYRDVRVVGELRNLQKTQNNKNKA